MDEWIHKIIDKYLFYVGIGILLLITLLIRLHMAPITCLSGDYEGSLIPWVQYYKDMGIKEGLAQSMGSYYVPYNVFLAIIAFLPLEPWVYISAFSILCDYGIAWFIYLISKQILEEKTGTEQKKKSAVIAAITLLIPAVFLNSALWKQCDSVYTLFLVMSIYYALKNKYNISLLWLSVSFVFKLQAVYILPLFVLLYIIREKKLSVFHFCWLPGMYLLTGLIPIIAGRRALDVYDCYYNQANYPGFDAMTMGMPNVYEMGLTDYPALNYPALLITMCIFIFLALFVKKKLACMNKDMKIYAGIWCLWACIMFLPAQHERYNYPVLILLTAYYLACDIKKLWVAIAINCIACFQYGYYLFAAKTISYQWLALFHFIAFIYMSYDLYRKIICQSEISVKE